MMKRIIELQAANQTLTVADDAKHFHNYGHTAASVSYLPAARAGLEKEFTDIAGVTQQVVAAGTDVIHYGSAVSVNGGKVTSSTGGTIRLKCLMAGHWHVVSTIGTPVLRLVGA